MKYSQIDMPESQHKRWRVQQLVNVAAVQSRGVQWSQSHKDRPVLKGIVRSASINDDWHWHYAKALACEDAQVSYTMPAGLTFGLLYEGEMPLEISACKHLLRAEYPLAFCFTNSHATLIKRKFSAGAMVHKFTLGIGRAWLNAMGLQTFCESNQLVSFSASEKVINTVNLLINLPKQLNFQQKLEQISNVSTLLAAVGALFQNGGCDAVKGPESQLPLPLEQKFLLRVSEIIRSENMPLQDIQVEDLALSLGTSVSGIQRLAKRCLGTSVLKYIRDAKLANALRAMKERNLTIGEAAYLAGYKQPSNFSLAFRRTFGFSPGEIRRAEQGCQ